MTEEINLNEKIEELQIIEHSLQNLSLQRQTLQVEISEIDNAISEIKKTNDEVYRVLGDIMLKSNKESLLKELSERKKVL